jgi:malonyl-CoA/methylmalonyl-CoA synthetase
MYDNNYLAHALCKATSSKPDTLFAELESQQRVSYGELFANAERVAKVLQDHGVKPGDRVAVQAGKSIAMLEVYLGSVLAGAVFLPLNTGYTLSEVEYFLNDATPQLFIANDTTISTMDELKQRTNVPALLSLSDDGLSGTLIEMRDNVTDGFLAIERNAEDLAAILYTSGTTGRSKGAMLSHGALASNAQTLAQYWAFTPEDKLIHALPIFHIHGLFVAINITLTVGSSLVFLSKFDADKIAQNLPKATVLMGVPTFYTRLLRHPDLTKDTVKNMRLFVSGSAPLLAETHTQWQQQTGHAILERYGMTETNMNTSNPYDGDRRPGTVGLPLPGVEIRLRDPDSGSQVALGDIGQIEVKGPNVFSGYWNMPEKTAEEFSDDGWFLTGDLAQQDSQGYISIVGRSKDMIISGGYNVYPKEIESIIDDVEGVEESAVIGIQHPDFGEAVVAVVVPQSSSQSSQPAPSLLAQVNESVQIQLASYKRPKQVVVVDELPRNTMGKVQKAQLRETYQQLFQNS